MIVIFENLCFTW